MDTETITLHSPDDRGGIMEFATSDQLLEVLGQAGGEIENPFPRLRDGEHLIQVIPDARSIIINSTSEDGSIRTTIALGANDLATIEQQTGSSRGDKRDFDTIPWSKPVKIELPTAMKDNVTQLIAMLSQGAKSADKVETG